MRYSIKIRRVERPLEKDVERDLKWICSSFGFCSSPEAESVASSIFRQIIHQSMLGHPISSTELARDVNMSRGAVVNHLNNLLDAGLVSRRGTRYVLRAGNLNRTIREIQRDMERIFEDMEEMAAELDERMGFKRRD